MRSTLYLPRYKAVLDPVRRNVRNDEAGGGGITSIRVGIGMSCSVSLRQEERTDIFTCKFEAISDARVIKPLQDMTGSY